ncbi:MAG: serine/threonine protein kinase [Anaerolineales bacterium]|nr:serine/threonine protein kinase [Anaerolineales bacterium]
MTPYTIHHSPFTIHYSPSPIPLPISRYNPNTMTEGALLNDRYQLQETLGTGGMANVYLARDVVLDRPVAIKVLRKEYSGSESFQKQFLLEARSAANLSHPNIVTVHDFGIADNLVYIVMEHVPGKDLKALVRERGRYPYEQAIPLLIQACAGVGYAHRAGLVHCDIKPHNMIVAKDNRLKVTDFGIARALATIKPGERNDVVWGSPLYFAPEQAAGETPTPASDVYSLGVVLYEILSGTPPFTAQSADELARLHISARPLPISEYVPDIPPALEEIVMKILSKEPSARYRTADQLGRVLQKFGAAPAPVKAAKEPVSTPPVITIKQDIADRLSPPSQPRPQPDPEPEYYRPPYPPQTIQPEPVPTPEAGFTPEPIDWAAVGLGLLALLAWGGLIPFGLMIYFSYFPPG